MSDTDPAVEEHDPAVEEEPPEAADQAPDDQEPDDQTPDDQADNGALAKARKEAAKHRHRLRDVEAERDQLQAQVTTLQQAQVAALAADRLIRPEDLLEQADLAGMLSDDGSVDPTLVAEAIGEVLADRPHLGRQARMPRKPTEQTPASTIHPDGPGGARGAGWAGFLRPGSRT